MKRIISTWCTSGLAAAALAWASVSLPALAADAQPTPEVMEPRALDALQTMGSFLRAQKRLHINADSSTDQVLDTGQVVQFSSHTDVLAVPPDKLRISVSHGAYRKTLYYDGKHFVVYDEGQRHYARGDAPPTIDALLDDMARKYAVVLPLADMLRWDTSTAQAIGLTAALYIDEEVIDQQRCAHYAYRMPGADWQLWVRVGPQAIPCQLVIVRTDTPAMPRHTVRYQWLEEAALPPNAFAFFPPVGTQAVPLQVIAPRAQETTP